MPTAAPSSAAQTPGSSWGSDEAALLRLWREKRGEVEPEDLSGNLIVQLGTVTEDLNRHWYERNTGQVVTRRAAAGFHIRSTTLDGGNPGRPGRGHGGAVFEAKFMLPWTFLGRSGRRKAHGAAAAQYVGHRVADGGAFHHYRRRQMGGNDHSGRSALPASSADRGERKFWRCVESGEVPHLFGIEPPRPRVEAVRTVDMSGSNAWAEFANLYRLTRPAALDHDRAKTELKSLGAGGRQGGLRARRAGQTIEIRRDQL